MEILLALILKEYAMRFEFQMLHTDKGSDWQSFKSILVIGNFV